MSFDMGYDPSTTDRTTMRRVRTIASLTLFLIPLVPVYGAIYLYFDLPWMVAALLFVGLGSPLNLVFVLKRARQPLLAGHIGLALLIIILVAATIAHGSYRDPVYAWMMLVPLCGGMLTNRVGSMIWCGVAIVATIAIHVVETKTGLMSSRFPPEWLEYQAMVNRITGLLAFTAAGLVFLLASEKAEEDAELSESRRIRFMANISHELRTPMSAIIGVSDALRGGLYGPVDQRQTRKLDQVHASGEHLLELANDLLDLSKIESGALQPNGQEIDLLTVVGSACGMLGPQAQAKGIGISHEVPEGLTAFADPRHVRQILINLLTNAVKFTPTGRDVGVRVSALDETIKVVVWDHGPGIPAVDLGTIFQAFVQTESAGEAADQGVGLGLSIVQRLVEANSGRIEVLSEVGEGTQFVVTLPSASEAVLREAV